MSDCETCWLKPRVKELEAENKQLRQFLAIKPENKEYEYLQKVEAIRNWLLDEKFQELRDNQPDHADYPRFGDFYEVDSEWHGDFWEWLEQCPMKNTAVLGKREVLGVE